MPTTSSPPALDKPAAPQRDDARFVARAESIAASIRAKAVRTASGAVTWMVDPPAPGEGRKPVDPYLYVGSGGVAMFLAVLDHARGTDEHRELVLGAAAPLRRTFAGAAAEPATALPALQIGGLVGIGAFVYAMTRLAAWTGAPELLDEAHAATRLLSPERIRGDARLDVMSGSAGTILALLALHAARPGANADGRAPLQVAAECAEHLLARRAPFDAGRAWPAGDGAPRPGFAHGAAGIGCALLRLGALTGDARLAEAALEAFAYERALYRPEQRDWWDARFSRYLGMQSWCTGAPAIVLARLYAPADDAEVREELRTALDITAAQPDGPVDDLCCGNLGRADVLLSAGRALGEPALVDAGRAIALRVIDRAPSDDALGFTAEAAGRTRSLFRGTAGVGWALLRQARPDAVPSCLLIE